MTPEEFLENFGVLAEAPSGLDKLREMILELAFQGRLVPPESSGESAATLIQQIPQGRARVITEETSLNSSTIALFREAPAHWHWVKLGQIAEVTGGITKGRDLTGRQVASYPYLRVANVQRGLLDLGVIKEIEIPISELDKYRLRRGDLLFTEGGDWDKLGRSAVWEEQLPACLHQNHVFKARLLSAKLNPHWFSQFSNSPLGRKYFADAAKQTTNLASINITQLRNFPVPVPPPMEQTRILAKVGQLMALCDELEYRQTKKRETGARLTQSALESLTNAESPDAFARAWQRVLEHFDVLSNTPESTVALRKAILELAVRGKLVPQSPQEEPAKSLLERVAAERARLIQDGVLNRGKSRDEMQEAEEPFSLPAGWGWARIGETFDVSGGIQKTPKRIPVKNHYPYLRVENVQRGRLDLSRIERFELADGELQRWRLASGDLLIVEGNGSETEIGRCALWNGAIEDCVHQNHLIRCRPILPLESKFTLLFLNSPSGMAEMKSLAITTSGLYSLSVGKIRGILIPVAPLEEQKRIIVRVEQLMALCDTLESRLRDAEHSAQRLAEAMAAEMVA